MKSTVTTQVVSVAGDRKHGMTLDEMASFIQTAMRQGVPGGTAVTATATWRQTIRELKVPYTATE